MLNQYQSGALLKHSTNYRGLLRIPDEVLFDIPAVANYIKYSMWPVLAKSH